ncbi:MAG: translation initiation factor [Myxococcota bacterium]
MTVWQDCLVAKRSRSSKKDASSTASSDSPFNSAFAGLAGLKDSLPDAADKSAAPTVEESVKPPNPSISTAYILKGKIALHREKKGRAGKTATRVSGLSLDAEGLAALARDMKKQLGCGAVVEDGDVVLLGDLGQRAADWLRAHGAKRVVGDGLS